MTENQCEVTRKVTEYRLQTTGSLQHHAFGILPNVVCTDGIMLLAKEAQCFWLLDAIASHQLDNRVGSEPFQVWILKSAPDLGEDHVTLHCEDGNDRSLTKQVIGWSSFPSGLLPCRIWAERSGSRLVLMMPEER